MTNDIYQNSRYDAQKPYYIMLNGHRYNAAYYNGKLMWGIKSNPFDPSGDFLKFSCPNAPHMYASVGIGNNGYTLKEGQKFYYSFDKQTWTEYTNFGTLISIPQNGYVYWYGTKGLGYWYDSYLHFIGHPSNQYPIYCSGNAMSLCGENWKDLKLVEAGQFECGFKDFTTLVTAPKLPAITVQEAGYGMMFDGCTSLVESPEIPDFINAQDGAMMKMFNGCSSLTKITCLITDPAMSWSLTDQWTNGVAANGTFIKSSTAQWSYGASGIPNGWTVQYV